MSISIQEVYAFGQTITAVLNDGKILDLRKGEVSEHAKACARYHAVKKNQGMIIIKYLNTFDAHMPAVEQNHD